jgi:stage II sporulation protein D
MFRRVILVLTICVIFTGHGFSQVRIRLFSTQTPETAVFTVTSGKYDLKLAGVTLLHVEKNQPVLITRYRGRLVVKSRHVRGFICDSISINGRTGKDNFTIRINDGQAITQKYTGDLFVYPDLGTLLMVNSCDIESYIAGVVSAEGGSGRNREYIKTQAILTRTYLYKHFNKHITDRFNVCDNTHCQAFNGISSDSQVVRSANETRDLVILDRDSILIVSAFHSNCGGETSTSADVWITNTSYLKKVADPYCLSGRNASWTRTLSLNEWLEYLKRNGYRGDAENPAVFNFSQRTRQTIYKIGSFTIPLGKIREELNLKSTFFSVIADHDSVVLRGRGYGHGVGLCQEGAMTMAREGHDYHEIINFYYSGVIITNIKNAVFLPENPNPIAVGAGL